MRDLPPKYGNGALGIHGLPVHSKIQYVSQPSQWDW